MAKNPSTVVGPLKIRYKGVFDMKGLLAFVYRWFAENHYDWHEKLYKEKAESALGNETEIKITGDNKVSEYFQYDATFEIHMWESKDVVVKVGGKDVHMMQGRIEIQVSGGVTRDWQNKFPEGGMWGSAQKFLDNFLLKNDFLFIHADKMEKEIHALNADIKRLLKMEAE